MSDTNYHSSRSSVTKQGKQSFQFLAVVLKKEFFSCCQVWIWIRLDPDPAGSKSLGSDSDPDLAGSDKSRSGMDPDPAR